MSGFGNVILNKDRIYRLTVQRPGSPLLTREFGKVGELCFNLEVALHGVDPAGWSWADTSIDIFGDLDGERVTATVRCYMVQPVGLGIPDDPELYWYDTVAETLRRRMNWGYALNDED